MNIKLLEKLYTKYIFEDIQGIKSDWEQIMDEYDELTGNTLVFETARKKITPAVRERLWSDHIATGAPSLPPTEREILGDGTQRLLAYMEMSEDDSKNPNAIMQMNGFDPKEWTLVKLKISEWTMGAKNQNYSVGLEVKPRDKTVLTIEDIDSMISRKRFEEIVIEPLASSGNDFLLLPLTDMHMGIADYDYYKGHQAEVNNIIERNSWDEIIFTIGSDLFHNDNFRGQTASGTFIEVVDMDKAWDDALDFYEPLIEAAQRHSQKAKIIFAKGNHDESMSWAFVKMLDRIYPNLEVDTKFEEAKCMVYKGNAVVFTHGDKAPDVRLAQAVRDLFEDEMSGRSKYVLRGHIHTQKMTQIGGVNVYALGTAAKTDQWHKDKFFLGNKKQFEVFTFNEYSMKEHIFIDGK